VTALLSGGGAVSLVRVEVVHVLASGGGAVGGRGRGGGVEPTHDDDQLAEDVLR